MTSLHLLLWIAGGILLQIALYMGVGFWRHWQAYRALRSVTKAFDLPVMIDPDPVSKASAAAAWAGLRTFRVERKVLEDAAGQVCSFYLSPDDAQLLPPFLPGQFLTFQLDVPAAKGGTESVIRCYSLSDAPQPNTYRVSIKRAPAPARTAFLPGISSNYFHDHVNVGSTLQVRAPTGHFHIDNNDSPVVLIGGGVGITPMLSMANWCLAEQPGRELWLFYGVRSRAEVVMPAHLQALAEQHANFHLHLCISDPQPSDLDAVRSACVQLHDSRADLALLRRLLPLKPYHFYICGPTPMLASLVPALEDWGVPAARIHFEAFGPASIPRKNAAEPSASLHTAGESVMVTFAKTKQQWLWEPGMGSLLDFAEAHGISVGSGCRAGGCGSCQTTIRAGEVVYTQSPDFDPEPGSCLLCVCTPKTAVTLEA